MVSSTDYEVVVPPRAAPTGIGISTYNYSSSSSMTFHVMCPSCCDPPRFLNYQNNRDPLMVCRGGCKFTSFPGIPESGLAHSGPRYQVMQFSSVEDLRNDLSAFTRWIELWTGLTGVEVQV